MLSKLIIILLSMQRQLPNLSFEKKLWERNFIIIGIDEVGRGALAGPLFVGAVCFKPANQETKINNIKLEGLGINDSKKLNAKKREKLAKIIKRIALGYNTAAVSATIINKVGIVKATQIAVRRAMAQIKSKLNGRAKIFLLTDAFYFKYIKGIGLKNQKAIVNGDEISLSIAAASIIAKVERDSKMGKLHQKYPLYLWYKNKGYGTKEHVKAIRKYGKSKLHRDLFLRKILNNNQKILSK